MEWQFVFAIQRSPMTPDKVQNKCSDNFEKNVSNVSSKFYFLQKIVIFVIYFFFLIHDL